MARLNDLAMAVDWDIKPQTEPTNFNSCNKVKTYEATHCQPHERTSILGVCKLQRQRSPCHLNSLISGFLFIAFCLDTINP